MGRAGRSASCWCGDRAARPLRRSVRRASEGVADLQRRRGGSRGRERSEDPIDTQSDLHSRIVSAIPDRDAVGGTGPVAGVGGIEGGSTDRSSLTPEPRVTDADSGSEVGVSRQEITRIETHEEIHQGLQVRPSVFQVSLHEGPACGRPEIDARPDRTRTSSDPEAERRAGVSAEDGLHPTNPDAGIDEASPGPRLGTPGDRDRHRAGSEDQKGKPSLHVCFMTSRAASPSAAIASSSCRSSR